MPEEPVCSFLAVFLNCLVEGIVVLEPQKGERKRWKRFAEFEDLKIERGTTKYSFLNSLLSRFDNGLTSSQCKFCSANTEDFQHLFVRYPMKWRVWIDAFNFFSPHLTFTQDDVCSILWSFRQFTFVDNIDLWRFTIDGFPFIDKQSVTRAMSQFATLTRGRLDLD